MKHAPHDTRLGQLQRGRGAGFLAACAAPGAARAELLRCIVDDPRIDQQIESREAYYAELAMHVDLALAPVIEHAIAGDAVLAVGVLAELIAHRHPEAAALIADPSARPELAAAVLDYLHCFPDWAEANLQITAVSHLAAHLDERGDLIDDVEIHGEFWQRWRGALPGVERAFIEAAAEAAAEVLRAPTPLVDPAALTTAELLEHVGGEDTGRIGAALAQRHSEVDRSVLAECVAHARDGVRKVAVAAAALGHLGDLRLLDAAAAVFARADLDGPGPALAFERQRRAAFLHYFRALPAALSLPSARAWWPRGGYLRSAAGAVLAKHAEPSDRGWLEAFVLRSATMSSEHAISAIEAVVHVGDPRSLPMLLTVAEQSTYSWARTRALRGVAAHASDPRALAVLREALWDCEDDARELGCRHADLTAPRSRARVAAIAAAPLADAGTRSAASTRISA